jgi:hypothetical protein
MLPKTETDFFLEARNIWQGIFPKNPRTGILGLFFALGLSFLFSMVIYAAFKNGHQVYSDIVFGDISYAGIYKSIDFLLYYGFTISFLFFLPLCIFFLNKLKIKDRESSFNFVSVLIGLLPILVLSSYKLSGISQFSIIFIFYIITLCFFGWYLKYSSSDVTRIACSFFSLYLSATGILAVLQFAGLSITNKLANHFDWVMLFLFVCMVGILYIWGEKDIDNINKLTKRSQLLIPLNLLILINTKYTYLGSDYFPPYMHRFSTLVCWLIVLLIFINIIYRFKPHCFNLITISVFTVLLRWNSYYNLIINTDPFHMGETAIVWQQIFEIGQTWNKSFVSVLQGFGLLCSGVNQILFGGDFASYHFSLNLIVVTCAVLIIVCLYFLVEKKWIVAVYAILGTATIMDRHFLIGILFLLMCNRNLIIRPMLWTLVYMITSLIHIWYQPTFGGTTTVAFLVGLIIIWFPQLRNIFLKQTNRNENHSLIIFAGVILVFFVVFIPFLLNILHFMKVNGYETQVTNGTAISQVLLSGPSIVTGLNIVDKLFFLLYKYLLAPIVCLVMVYLFLVYVIREKNIVLRVQGTILSLSAFFVFVLSLPAVITRVDAWWSRITCFSMVFVTCIFPILIYLYWNKLKYKNLALIFIGICLSGCIYARGFAVVSSVGYFPTSDIFTAHKQITARVEIPSNTTLYKGNELGLSHLGDVFTTDKNYIDQAVALREVCDALLKPEQTYYDMTDRSIYYLYTGRKVPGKYVSSMVSTNEYIQKEVIEQLEKNDVPLVFVNDTVFPNLSTSIRYYRIYRFFLSQDYHLINYKGNSFLVRGDIDLTPIQDRIQNKIKSVLNISSEQIQSLIVASFPSVSLNKDNILFTNDLSPIPEGFSISGNDPHAVLGYNDTDKPVSVSEIKFLELVMPEEISSPISAQLFIEPDQSYIGWEYSINFTISSRHTFVPVDSFSSLQAPGNLKYIRFDVDNKAIGSNYPLITINIYTINYKFLEDIQEFANSFNQDNELNERFYIPNFAMLPSEWGRSFDKMKQRFSQGEYLSLLSNSLGQIELVPSLPQKGLDMEFVLLKISNISNIQDISINISGVDEYGEIFSLPFSFKTSYGNSNYLIPFGSAPTFLRAKSIDRLTLLTDDSLLQIQDAVAMRLIK